MNCTTGKIRYRSQLDAQLALSRCARRKRFGMRKRRESRVYRCPYCFGYHLTSQRKPHP